MESNETIALQKVRQANIVMSGRSLANANNTPELLQKRTRFVQWLNNLAEPLEIKRVPVMIDTKNGKVQLYSKGKPKMNSFVVRHELELLEMYQGTEEDDAIKSSHNIFNGDIKKFWNTRTKLNCETCLETDKLPIESSFNLLYEVTDSLDRSGIHYAIFYANHARSPHIRIYDFMELKELTPFQRVKAQVKFWRKHVPMECFHYIDTGMFQDNHYLCLEFAPHWKYGSVFDLLWESPEGKPEMELGYVDGGKICSI